VAAGLVPGSGHPFAEQINTLTGEIFQGSGRPVMASTSDSNGPMISGPVPWTQSVSVARKVSPAMRRFAPTIRLDPW
jgi:hypothetical protein